MLSRKIFGRRQTLLGLGGLAGIGASVIGTELNKQYKLRQIQRDSQNRNFKVTSNTALGQRAATKGLIYGAAVRQYALSSDTKLAESVVYECKMIVPEWELKWNYLRPTPTSFNFAPADWLADFSRRNGLLFRGHTLVWHEALPIWFPKTINSKNARQLLLEHITTVVKHYAGHIHSWDVVNEAIDPRDRRSDGLKNTPWLQFIGQDYIEIAFSAAAESDPNTLLVYNDYGLQYDTHEHEAKRNAVLKLLENLKSKDIPIHALGIQSHLSGYETRFNPDKFKKFLSEVASLGLKILITEMDVADNKLPSDIKFRDPIVAGVYEDYLSVALEEPAVISVLTWGLSDSYTWLSQNKPRKDQATVRTLPLDTQMRRKLAWNAIARAFDKATKR
ncbi:endo-1,4-beta-xylanase [Nostoc sp. FACHB-110]|uniref:endo-1,4-beta-xylanase n=1 Tax=Nostoc sp. FACHB-110 TaxID=2692834 RepID=UPI0037C8C414